MHAIVIADVILLVTFDMTYFMTLVNAIDPTLARYIRHPPDAAGQAMRHAP